MPTIPAIPTAPHLPPSRTPSSPTSLLRFVPECNIVGSRSLLPSPMVVSIAVGLYITLHSLWTICVDRGSLLKALSRQFAVDPLVAVLDGLRVFNASNTLSRRPSVAPPLRLSMRLVVGFLVAH